MTEEKNEEIFETIDIDISDHDFLILAKRAHEQDITLNQLFINVIKEGIERDFPDDFPE